MYNDSPEAYWNAFYGEKKGERRVPVHCDIIHRILSRYLAIAAESFFKDRKWLCTEFPDLGAATAPDVSLPQPNPAGPSAIRCFTTHLNRALIHAGRPETHR